MPRSWSRARRRNRRSSSGPVLAETPDVNFIPLGEQWEAIANHPNVAMVIVVRMNQDNVEDSFETFVSKTAGTEALKFKDGYEYQA